MKAMNKSRKAAVGASVLAAVVMFSLMGHAGSLEPSGPPASTMKTLDEIEPRTPIGSLPFTIDFSGSYYVTQDLLGSPFADGITIKADNVTLDLSGFTLTGVLEVQPNNGIDVNGVHENILICNGVLRNWSAAIEASAATNSQIRDLRVEGNAAIGIELGSGGLVLQCAAESNNGGIRVGVGSSVIQCTARDNTGAWAGIYTGNQCLVTDCAAMGNNNHGIRAGADSTVTNNTASDNTGNGIFAAASLVCGNTANRNTTNGIEVSFHCIVKDNLCALNTAAGILVTDGGNRIDGNQTGGNNVGIDVDGTLNLIVRNSSISGSPEYDIVPGNKVGATSTNPATAGPWDNFDL